MIQVQAKCRLQNKICPIPTIFWSFHSVWTTQTYFFQMHPKPHEYVFLNAIHIQLSSDTHHLYTPSAVHCQTWERVHTMVHPFIMWPHSFIFICLLISAFAVFLNPHIIPLYIGAKMRTWYAKCLQAGRPTLYPLLFRYTYLCTDVCLPSLNHYIENMLHYNFNNVRGSSGRYSQSQLHYSKLQEWGKTLLWVCFWKGTF